MNLFLVKPNLYLFKPVNQCKATFTGRKRRESRANFLATFNKKDLRVKFHKNSKIKMSRQLKVANC